MVLRKIKIGKKQSIQSGGARIAGEDVKSISTFLPSSIPDLALWIKVGKESLKYSTIADYIKTQSITVQQSLRNLFKDRLNDSIITEIIGANNSLIRFELDSGDSLSFPKFISDPSGADVISLNYDTIGDIPKSFKLVTKEPIKLQDKYSMWSTSENVNFNYIPTFNQFVISPDLVAYGNSHISKFSEIIVYSRELNRLEKQQIEGYLAYVNNNQYILPFHHQYLPDMSYLPELTTIASSIKDIENSIKSSMQELNQTHTDPSGNHLILRGRLTETFNELSVIRDMFSKGTLLAKRNGLLITLDSIYNSANSLNLLTVPFSPDYVNDKITTATHVLSDVNSYIQKSVPSINEQVTKIAETEKIEQENQLATVETEETFQDTEREIKAHEFYETLRNRSYSINLNGQSMYGPIYKNFEDRITVYWEAISYNAKQIEEKWNTLTALFKGIETQINSRSWLKYTPLIDTSEAEVIKRGNFVYSIQYRDNYLNMIQTQYQKMRNQIYDGDMAYINNIVPIKIKELEAIVKAVENKEIQPITIKTFLPHFKQRYDEITKYTETFDSLVEVLMKSIQSISDALDYSKKNAVAGTIDDLPVISNKDIFRSECDTVYIRKVNSSDATLTGIEYIVTDVEGNIQGVTNSDGDIDNTFVFSKYMKLESSQEDLMFILYHPYKDNNGTHIRQEYKILEELPSVSIIDSLSKIRKPNYWFHKGSSLFEITRDQINGIHQIVVEYAQYPIQLPKYAIPVGSYFLIQNVGPFPIQIQNPGFPDDMIDTIGYGEMIIYIYSGLQESYGNTYYGRVPWREGYIPYDTLTNSPRSAYSVFIKELSVSIYVKKNLEPILDFDGYFVKAVTDSKGYTYDIDDVYLANPYKVQSIKEMSLADLKNKGTRLTIKATDQAVWILKDIVTSLPVLCNSKGTPGINEYGYCKFAKTPLMLIDNKVVIRGAFGDINVLIAPTIEIEQMGMLEPFLDFNAIYRSKIVQPYSKGSIKTFVFIGQSKYPILSPKNNFIEAEEWTLNPPHEVIYTSSKGVKSVAFLLKDSPTIKDSQINVAPYAYVLVQDTRSQIEMKKSAKIILNRYNTNKNYILDCLDTIKSTSEHIKKLGIKASEGPISVLNTANEQIFADFKTYEGYTPSVESIQASLDAKILSNSLKITIDMLDLKMKTLIESVSSIFNSISESIKVTTDLVNDIESIENNIKDFREKSVIEIEQRITSVRATLQADAQNQKITGAPEFDRLLKLMIKYKVDFLQRLGTVENSLKIRPEYTTEYPNWIKTQKGQIKELNGLLIKIREIEQTDIPRIFTIRETIKRTEYTQKFREIASQIDTYKKYKKTIGLWLGILENANYVKETPIINTGEPEIKGITTDLIVFNELKNPSVQRDWQELHTSAEISGKILSQLIGPIESVKEKYRFFLLENKINEYLPVIEKFNEIDLKAIRIILDNIQIKMDEVTKELIAFETDLSPIIKAYENIRSDLRAELRSILSTNNEKIREKNTRLSDKRIAMQTILTQHPDSEKEAEIELQFETEQKANKIIVNNPTYYDSLSYFKLKGLVKEQDIILKELDLIV